MVTKSTLTIATLTAACIGLSAVMAAYVSQVQQLQHTVADQAVQIELIEAFTARHVAVCADRVDGVAADVAMMRGAWPWPEHFSPVDVCEASQ